MTKLTQFISRQFGNPHGFVGKIMTKLMNIMNKKLYRKVVALTNTNSVDSILDIGYGNGFLIQKLYQKTKSTIYGIDISEDAASMAEKRNRRAKKDNHLFLSVGDVCHLSYSDETFSSISSVNTIYFWEDIVEGLSEIRRTLKPKSAFINAVYTKEFLDSVKYTETGFTKLTKEEYIELGRKAGFANIKIQDISKKAFVVIYTKD